MAKRKRTKIADDMDDVAGEEGDEMPHLVNASQAIELLSISRSNFFQRVRDGVYREARLRASDPKPREKLFRAHEITSDEILRQHMKQNRGSY
jgi:hypothetical protein